MNIQPYEWMVKETPQRLWSEGRGIWVWLAEALGILGGGLYVAGLFFQQRAALFWGWLVVMGIKGGCHLLHLGYPTRFLRLLARPKTSWLSRGFVFLLLFSLLGIFPFLPGQRGNTPVGLLLSAVNTILALWIITYGGFVLNSLRGIPLWATPLLPLIFLTQGLTVGFSLITLFVPLRILFPAGLIVVNALVITLYLLDRVQKLQGPLRGSFFSVGIGYYGAGVLLPLVALAVNSPIGAYVFAGGVVIGVFSFTYFLMGAAFYEPLL